MVRIPALLAVASRQAQLPVKFWAKAGEGRQGGYEGDSAHGQHSAGAPECFQEPRFSSGPMSGTLVSASNTRSRSGME